MKQNGKKWLRLLKPSPQLEQKNDKTNINTKDRIIRQWKRNLLIYFKENMEKATDVPQIDSVRSRAFTYPKKQNKTSKSVQLELF